MSVYDAEKEIREYLSNLYTSQPKKPTLKNNTPTAEELSTYIEQSKKYDLVLEEFKTKKDLYESEGLRLYSLLEEKIKDYSGLNDIPEQYRDKVYRYAYSQGHSSGYVEVYQYLCDLVDIFV